MASGGAKAGEREATAAGVGLDAAPRVVLPKPYYSDEFVTLYHGDCREIAPNCDAIVTDPPYGTGGWRRSVAGAGDDPSGSLIREAWDDGRVDWLRFGVPTLTFWPPARTCSLLLASYGYGLVKHRALYMHKLDPKPQPSGRTSWSVEPIWCLSPNGFLMFGGTDWCEVSTPRLGRDSEAVGHPYQKPIEAMRWLLRKVSHADVVLDPFAGSGTTLRAAKDLGRKAIGIEIEERYCEIAAKRLAQGVLWEPR